jgi:protein involved in polysaccharide export with SLBB domain
MKHCVIALLISCSLLSAEPPAASDNYRLAPDDLLQVKVFREEDMDSTVRISRDGTVTLPLIGVVRLGGMTANEAGVVVRDLLDRDYIVKPQVTVTVMEFTRLTFTILGQVQKPGSYKIPSQGTFTLLQAIGRGGGYTRIANPGNVTVKRQAPGRETLLKLNAKTIAKDESGQPFVILPGDTITVGESIF